MHRTLKTEMTRPPAADLRARQRSFDRFREEYNRERRHEARGLKTPSSLYVPSPRPYPERLPRPEYPAHFETRYVSENGGIRWRSLGQRQYRLLRRAADRYAHAWVRGGGATPARALLDVVEHHPTVPAATVVFGASKSSKLCAARGGGKRRHDCHARRG